MAKMTKRQARQWLREHFSDYVRNTDFGSSDEPEGPGIEAVLSDEKDWIARRILGRTAIKSNETLNGVAINDPR